MEKGRLIHLCTQFIHPRACHTHVDKAGVAHPSSCSCHTSVEEFGIKGGAAYPSIRVHHSDIKESGKVSGRWGSLPTAWAWQISSYAATKFEDHVGAHIPSVIFGADAHGFHGVGIP